MQLKLVLAAYCSSIFIFQACIKFFNFQIGGPGTPLATPIKINNDIQQTTVLPFIPTYSICQYTAKSANSGGYPIKCSGDTEARGGVVGALAPL